MIELRIVKLNHKLKNQVIVGTGDVECEIMKTFGKLVKGNTAYVDLIVGEAMTLAEVVLLKPGDLIQIPVDSPIYKPCFMPARVEVRCAN